VWVGGWGLWLESVVRCGGYGLVSWLVDLICTGVDGDMFGQSSVDR
jgi:hypothetical protein